MSQQPDSDTADRITQNVEPRILKQPLKPCREGVNNPSYMETAESAGDVRFRRALNSHERLITRDQRWKPPSFTL